MDGRKRKDRISLSHSYLPRKIKINSPLPSSFKPPKKESNLKDFVSKICGVDELTKNSILKPGLEQQHSLPPLAESLRIQRKKRQLEREKTKGEKWYNIPAREMTEELKNDLTILQMRSVLDRKQFYKKNDLKVLPKYFQVGTVMDDAADFYHARVPKRERKKNLVEELLADVEFKKYNKRKYVEVQAKQKKRYQGAKKHMKRLKKNK